MKGARDRFKLTEYTNPRTDSVSFRVSGTKRDGTRVRENFSDAQSAKCRQIELEGEFLARETETMLRATRMTDTQVRLAELAFSRLTDDSDLTRAVDYWLTHGKQNHVANSPRIDDAVAAFKLWLEGTECTLRDHSRRNLKIRVNVFGNSVSNLHVNEVTPDTIQDFVSKIQVAPVTRDNYRRAVSSFFSWCIERPRRWIATNPCREIRVEKGEAKPPAILTVDQCRELLKAAGTAGLAPYVALCLFGGLRPFEASRVTWAQINLKDRELRLEANQTKTGDARVVGVCPTLLAWLQAHEGKPVFPTNWRKAFDAVKATAKIVEWPVDVMRHTAISHYFRKTGSYGLTAEQFGNSESVIKAHYQGRVSSAETKKFYAIKP
jgi:integrase